MDTTRLPQSSFMALNMLMLKAGMTCKWRMLNGDVRLRITGSGFDRGWLCYAGTRPLDDVIETLASAVLQEFLPKRQPVQKRLALAA
jgi:hypothetical protein